jgi:hypothetical protein
MQLGTGLSGYAAIGYTGSGRGYQPTVGLGHGGAVSPDPGAGTATQQAFGTLAGAPATGGGRGNQRVTYGVLSTGSIALALLVWTWWSLPV